MLPIFPSEVLTTANTQPNSTQGEHCTTIAISPQKTFWQTLGCQIYSFLKQQNKQMMLDHYSLVPAFAVFTRHMQFSNSSASDKKILLEFTMLMNFRLQVKTCETSIFYVFMQTMNRFC